MVDHLWLSVQSVSPSSNIKKNNHLFLQLNKNGNADGKKKKMSLVSRHWNEDLLTCLYFSISRQELNQLCYNKTIFNEALIS